MCYDHEARTNSASNVDSLVQGMRAYLEDCVPRVRESTTSLVYADSKDVVTVCVEVRRLLSYIESLLNSPSCTLLYI